MKDLLMKITQEKISRAQYQQYLDREICFSAEGMRFSVKNIAREYLLRIIPSHAHGENSYEMHYIISGQGWIKTRFGIYEARSGTLFLMGPGEEHAQLSKSDDPMEYCCIYFHLEELLLDIPKGSLADCFLKTTGWIGQDYYGMNRLLQNLFHELTEKRPGYMTGAESILSQIFVNFVRNYYGTGTDNQKSAAEIVGHPMLSPDNSRAFVVEKAFLYDFADLTLESLSERIGLSPRQTQRFLRENYGRKFQELRTKARMSAAEMLLVYTNCSITWIAQSVGYTTAEYFATNFRYFYGKSPRYYWKEKCKSK